MNFTVPSSRKIALLGLTLITLLSSGCGRRDYRLRADRDAFCLLDEKSAGTPWDLPRDFSIYPNADSRLFDPTNPDCPWLPDPGPNIYEPHGETDQQQVESNQPDKLDEPESSSGQQELPATDEGELDSRQAPVPSDVLPEFAPPNVVPADSVPSNSTKPEPLSTNFKLRRLPEPINADHAPGEIALASAFQIEPPLPADSENDELKPDSNSSDSADLLEALKNDQTASFLPVQPIPLFYWNAIPSTCLDRMLEFESVGSEYARVTKDVQQTRTAQGLNLAEIMRLALLNSRDFQTQKEELYQAALAVSLQRFDYQLKFSPGGNGTDVDYLHRRSNGITENGLSVPTRFQVERMLARGGTFLARFANDVVLTFNGPDGFASDVSSELLFELTQSVLQRDIKLEALIQSERSLVYAARNFARFRKQFFLSVAEQYYSILRNYRSIEIDSQNYFSLVRTVEQATAEVAATVENAPNQVAVDQFEQSMLSGRSNLISTCNNLERALDQLKLQMGLPTDMPIDIDLDELERLTLLDEIEVAAERVRRWRSRVERQLNSPRRSRGDILNATVFLIERLLEWQQLTLQLEANEGEPSDELQQEFNRFQVDRFRVEVGRIQTDLDRMNNAIVRQPDILKFDRNTALISAYTFLVRSQIVSAIDVDGKTQQLRKLAQELSEIRERLAAIREELADVLRNSGQSVADQLAKAEAATEDIRQISQALDKLLEYDSKRSDQLLLSETISEATRIAEVADGRLTASRTGLPKVGINAQEAMMTALLNRLDLMNERGLLADDWRQIKLASDDLRSVLDLNARHVIRTDRRNRPFDFDFDDSTTQLSVDFDLPLNRRSQRNDYRNALIQYQQGRRNLMELEDQIKLAIREDLRVLRETRVQYPISVTQAALAAEQVTSTRLQLALGIEGVRGTDLLDALQVSREALTSVANQRIGYIADRAEFVLELELMQLDEDGFWPQINDAEYRAEARTFYPPNAYPTYGRISPCVKPTRCMYHIYDHRLPGQ